MDGHSERSSGALRFGRTDVGVILGSASDLDKTEQVFHTLSEFGVTYEVAIISAHRTPHLLQEYADSVAERGVKVLIAAAGLAAALPGALSALVDAPVVGLPLGGGPVDGIDALLSVADMPPGVPVAAVGIDSARNAALLAVRILAASDEDLRRKLTEFRRDMAVAVLDKASLIEDRGLPGWKRD